MECEISDPEERPDADSLLSHGVFNNLNPYGFPFEDYVTNATLAYTNKKMVESALDSDDDSEDSDATRSE